MNKAAKQWNKLLDRLWHHYQANNRWDGQVWGKTISSENQPLSSFFPKLVLNSRPGTIHSFSGVRQTQAKFWCRVIFST